MKYGYYFYGLPLYNDTFFFQKASFKAYLQKKIINRPCLSEDLVGIQTVQRDTFKNYRNIPFSSFLQEKVGNC